MVLLAIFVLGGCASPPRVANEDPTGLATVSALLIAMPLIPFAAAYDKVTGSKEKQKRDSQQLRQILDPVYERRAEIIQKLNASEQAEKVYKSGSIAFFPLQQDSNVYSGIDSYIVPYKNEERLRADPLLNYFQTLMTDDPAQKLGGATKLRYQSDAYTRFQRASALFQRGFNTRMQDLSVGDVEKDDSAPVKRRL